MNPELQNPSCSQRALGAWASPWQTLPVAPFAAAWCLFHSEFISLEGLGPPLFSSFINSASFPSLQSLPLSLYAHTPLQSAAQNLLALLHGARGFHRALAPSGVDTSRSFARSCSGSSTARPSGGFAGFDITNRAAQNIFTTGWRTSIFLGRVPSPRVGIQPCAVSILSLGLWEEPGPVGGARAHGRS